MHSLPDLQLRQENSAPVQAALHLLAEGASSPVGRICGYLRKFEKQVFSGDPCSSVGLAAGQLRLLLLRRDCGISVQVEELVRARSELERALEAAA